jgi:Flp pilus assembly protein TadG
VSTEKGQAAVELALVLPVLLLFSLSVLAVGQIVGEYRAVRAASSQAAYAAARAPSPQAATAAGRQAALEALTGSGVQGAVVTVDAGTFPRGGVVSVRTEAYIDLGVYPLVRDYLGRWFKLSWTAHQLIEPYRSRQPG